MGVRLVSSASRARGSRVGCRGQQHLGQLCSLILTVRRRLVDRHHFVLERGDHAVPGLNRLVQSHGLFRGMGDGIVDRCKLSLAVGQFGVSRAQHLGEPRSFIVALLGSAPETVELALELYELCITGSDQLGQARGSGALLGNCSLQLRKVGLAFSQSFGEPGSLVATILSTAAYGGQLVLELGQLRIAG